MTRTFSARHKTTFYLCAAALSLLISGCGRDDTPAEFEEVTLSTPNKFLQYPNMHASLAAGRYKVVATTSSAGQSGSFNMTINYDDGSQQSLSGQWSSSAGPNATPATSGDPSFDFELTQAGGIRIELRSSRDAYLYLLNRNNQIIAEDDNSGGGTHAMIDLPRSRVDNAAWATAYYAAIDPNNERDTLNKWKTRNGFDQDPGTHIIFRDTKDLGYGRSMYFRAGPNGCAAIYVENFAVDLVDGLPYTTLNLHAAIENDRLHHFGTNAIEYSDLDGDCDGSDPMFNKFYTFRADPRFPNADEPRIIKVDLDGRGEKYMPIPCITCHGGTARPLMDDGSFPSAALPDEANPALRIGDTDSKLQPVEVDSFEYSTASGYSRAEQESRLRALNRLVYNTFPTATTAGHWQADFIREVVDGWYGGDINTSNSAFDGSFVPQGWKYDPSDGSIPASRPPTSEQLFLDVIKPYCFACHSKRGSDLGTNTNAGGDGQDVNFSSYEKFISYADRIEDYVYVRGIMPMSLLTFEEFWASDAPEILASHLPGFSHANADGSIDIPGKPIARTGPDRTTTTPATLHGSSSLFASYYNWSVVNQPTGSNATFSDDSVANPIFSTDMDGNYQLQLVVSNGIEQSTAATLNLTVDSSLMPAVQDITFDSHIKTVLQTDCVTCHATGLVPGIPVFYTDNAELYNQVMLRVNLSAPELSKLLSKPTGNHHYGGIRGDDPGEAAFYMDGAPTEDDDYNLFVNWILNGAREN